jgi:hypothetical protein
MLPSLRKITILPEALEEAKQCKILVKDQYYHRLTMIRDLFAMKWQLSSSQRGGVMPEYRIF